LTDPNAIIAANKQVLQSRNEPPAASYDKETDSQKARTEEDLLEKAAFERKAREIEMDHRREDYKVESACTLQKMLNQPYVGPVLAYEKKAERPHERAYIQKAQTYGRTRKGEPVQIVK
jgi:hypothetical protein|tara:strand:+ start:496 stop:852 length:357 start_codon:yes stop_codon:yes gene_type:complete